MTTTLRDQLQATLSGTHTLERELGGGGMSKVFVAEETRLKRKVVVKVLSPELAQGISIERFEREIQTVAALQQANIVPVISAGDTNGLPYYTMPFVEGESLRARLARGPLAVTEVIGVLRDVSKALAYAHQRSVVHRDIKPDNVLLSGGTAVVTDFGIAKAISAARTGSGAATLTQVGTSIGTPAYMAPEQAAGDSQIDHRADIYSLGAMAYELLSGQAVFANRTPQRMLAAHMGEAPAPITQFRADLPPALADLVMHCLAKDASARPQNAAEIARVLESITSGSGMQAMPPVLLGGPAMFKRALAIYAGAFVAVAILAKAAIVGIGLPDWVFPGSLVVMALGLPVILWTGYVQRVARRAMTMTPTFTPGGSPSMAQGTIATMALKAAPKMSWYRTARGGMYAMGTFIAVIAAFMVMRAFGIGPAATLFSAGTLSEKERILLTDFSVTSGDTSLARVVSFGVRTALSQSSALTVVDQPTVAAALERMDRPRTSRIDLPLAQGIAIREGIKAIVDGEVTPVASGYVLTLRLVSSDSTRLLASFQATGNGPEGLIAAADKVARQLRAKVGESLRTVQNAPPLAKARTASLEALRKYSEGYFANMVAQDRPKALRLMREAVAIDTAFAEGYRTLWAILAGFGAPRLVSDSALTRAFQLRERLPDAERLNIEGAYYSYTGGGFQGPGRDRGRSIAAYERMLALGVPGFSRNNIAVQLGSRREFARAESLHRADVAVDSNSLLVYGNLLANLVSQGKTNAADSVISAEIRRFPSSSVPKRHVILRLVTQGHLDEAQKALDSARARIDPTDPAWAPRQSASLAVLRGRLRDWRQLRSQALAADSTVGRRPSPIADAIAKAIVQAVVLGDRAAAVTTLDAATTGTAWKNVPDVDRLDLNVAGVLAQLGQAARARAVLGAYEEGVRDTSLRRIREPDVHLVRAELALAERKPAEAIREFRLADRLPDGPANGCTICLPVSLARAFDAADQPDSAIAQFELYVQRPLAGRVNELLDPTLLPMVHERLGQLYEAKGTADKAAEHYRKFIELWKNADPELQPRVAEARRRFTRLTPVERPR